jgi:hypothetical protein
MSDFDPTVVYAVTLRHLTSDAKAAGANLPDVKLADLPAKKLKALLLALGKLAPTVAYPAVPEVRITAPQGMFVVKVNGGRLEFVSWSAQHAGGILTAAQIYSAITGDGIEEERPAAAPEERGKRGTSVFVSILIVAAIILVNSFTAWTLLKPKKTLLPKYTLMKPEPAERVLASTSGIYETGTAAGDRQLKISKSGEVEWVKFGANKAAKDKKNFTVTVARIGEKTGLLTSRKAMIEVHDATVLVLYGDTYRRTK